MGDIRRVGTDFLSSRQVELIVDEAYRVLEKTGVRIGNDEARRLVTDAGARISRDGERVFLPRPLCERCLESAPGAFTLYDREGAEACRLGDGAIHFTPGSAATLVYDYGARGVRKPVTRDVVEFIAVTDMLSDYDAQSTGVVPHDVAADVADRYRLFLALVYGRKPVITGTFTRDAFSTMLAFLVAVRGSEAALRKRPLAMFDCCPTSPLQWSDLAARSLLDCARSGVPVEIVPAPLIGGTAPVTLAGTLVQHTAENLSGIVIHQTAAPGSPVVYGGAPALLDMRRGSAPMAALEAVMAGCAHARLGRHFGLPVHAYMGLSDAKLPDFQAGFETTLGAALAALSGVDMAAGAGMLNYANCQSLEKLVADHEICAAVRRLSGGITMREDLGFDAISECAADGSFLTSEHTRRFFREEIYYPSDVIDRSSQGDWEQAGSPDTARRAHESVRAMLDSPDIAPLDTHVSTELEALMKKDAAGAGMEALPDWRSFIDLRES